MQILLIEDSEMTRDMLSRRLASNNFHVLLAVDGEEGVAMAVEHRPDLILLNMGLTRRDALEAIRRIKRGPFTFRIPVIALTNHVVEQESAVKAGCDDWDTKPIDLHRLLGKIRPLLPQEQQGQ